MMKNPNDLGKTVEKGVDPCLPQFPGQSVLLVNLQQLAIVRLNVGTSDCTSDYELLKLS